MSDIPETYAAVKDVDGVASATLRWPDPLGPAHLTITFAGDLPAGEHGRVAAEVTDVLARVGGADLSTLQLDAQHGRERPAFAGLSVRHVGAELTVEVELHVGDRQLRGQAEGVRRTQASLRAAAMATLAALEGLVEERVRIELEWVRVEEAATPGGLRLVECAVTVLAPSGTRLYVGSAVSDGDLLEAAVRATLDALNRQLEVLAAA